MHVVADIGAYPIFTFIPDLTLMMGVGVYHVQERRSQDHVRVHQHHVGRAPIAARAGRRPPTTSSGWWTASRRSWASRPRTCAGVNFIPPSAFPYAAPTGQNYDSGEYDARAGQEPRGRRSTPRSAPSSASGSRPTTASCSASAWPATSRCAASGPYESAMVRVEPSGTVTAYTGTSAHGQGHETTFAQIIADYLGVDFDQVVVRHGDTTGAPMGFGTGGSRSLVVGGSAMVKAAEKVQEQARRVAASALEAAFEDVVVTDGPLSRQGLAGQEPDPGARSPRRPTARACPPGWSRGSRPPSTSGRRSSSIRSARTWRWWRWIATPAGSRCATSSRWTTAACASARSWWTGRCTAASRRASPSHSWRKWSTARTASSSPAR